MIKETGQIIEIKTIAGEKIVVVECVSKSACKSCSSNDNCGVGVVAKGASNKTHQLEIPYKEGMEVNRSIELLIENKDIIQSSLIIYTIPLIVFVLTSLISYQFTQNEPFIIILSLASLLIGCLIAKYVSAKLYPDTNLNKLISTK